MNLNDYKYIYIRVADMQTTLLVDAGRGVVPRVESAV